MAGGLLVVGGYTQTAVSPSETAPAELFDEASGRWFELPHPMAQARSGCSVVSLPAAALEPALAAAGGAAAAGP